MHNVLNPQMRRRSRKDRYLVDSCYPVDSSLREIDARHNQRSICACSRALAIRKFQRNHDTPAPDLTSSIEIGRQRRPAPDHVGRLLRHHQNAGVDMRRDNIGHGRRIHHAQALDPAHLAAPDRAPCRAPMPMGRCHRVVRRDRGPLAARRRSRRRFSRSSPGVSLDAAIGLERLLIGHVAGALEAFAQRRQIVRRGEEIVDDAQRRARIGRAQQHLAAAVGMQQRRPDAVAVDIGRA